MTKLDWAKANRAEMPKVARPKTETQKRQEAVAKAYANGTARERERIIQLLNRYLDFHPSIGISDLESGHQLEPNHVIRLIEGKWK
jgi:hypothetical protein